MAGGKSGSKSSSSGERLVRTGAGLDNIHPALVPYEDKIINPSEGQILTGWGVHAKNRVELAEALPYFQISRGSTYIEDDIVRGFLLNDDVDDGAYIGRQGYMDAETVIAKIPAVLPWHNTVTGRLHATTRKRARADLAIQFAAFYNNLHGRHPLVLILDRKWKDSIFDDDGSDQSQKTRYLVLDHFIVANIWREPSSVLGAGDAFFVRFERLDLQYASWWNKTQIIPPPLNQRDFSLLPEIICPQCGLGSVQIYEEDWFCCSPSCVHFGFNGLGEAVASRDLNFHPAFLKQRAPRERYFAPKYDLQPDLLGLIKSQQGYTLSGKAANRASSNLWRAIVCPNCMGCVPRIFWYAWRCNACKRLFPYEPSAELYQRYSFMDEFGLSPNGHPTIDISCPDDYSIQQPLLRDLYRMDRVFLHGDAFITLISPTEEFNQREHGPNDVFNQLLAQAPVNQIPLRRRRLYPFDKHSGKRTPYFTAMYGEQYDFSSLTSIPQNETPDSVSNAGALLVHATNAEVPKDYTDKFNQSSLECYFDGMLMPWHTPGDRELGSTIAMVSLGSKAELRVRLKQHIYENSNLSKVIKGSYNWKNLAEAKKLIQSGVSVDDAYDQMPFYDGPSTPPEVVMPLNHGSIVIFQGKHFPKYFEHTITNADDYSGNLRFSVTARHVNAEKHAAVKARHPFARQAGPKFSFIHDPYRNPDVIDDYNDLPDEGYGSDDDSDDSDDDNYHDYSTSRSSDPYKTKSLPSRPRSKKAAAVAASKLAGLKKTPVRTGRGKKMRGYHDENDDDTLTPPPVAPGPAAKGRARKGGRATTAGKTLAKRTPRASAKGRGKAAARSRSRSPDDSSTPLRSRSPTFSPIPMPDDYDDDDGMEGLGPIAAFNAVMDPDNIPRSFPGLRTLAPAPGYEPATGSAPSALVARAPATLVPAAPGAAATLGTSTPSARGRRNKGGKIGGSVPGRHMHMWTPEENTALGQAGIRVTKGQSTWQDEMDNGNLPEDVTVRCCKERFFRMRKKGDFNGWS